MVTCNSCGKRHIANTLFCDECAAYLQVDQLRRTNPLNGQEVAWAEEDPRETHVLQDRGAQAARIRIKILDSGREIDLAPDRELTLGRLDPSSATFPDIDLTQEMGLEKGVSRRHAKIGRSGGNLHLEDLGSVNGTYLNGRRLTPYMPQSLRNRDEIRLSRVLIRVEID